MQARPPADLSDDQHVRVVPVPRRGELFMPGLAEAVERNLRLLELDLADDPHDPYLHYQVGKTRYVLVATSVIRTGMLTLEVDGKMQTFPLIKASKGSAKARAELGYRDVVTPREALQESVDWYRQYPVDPDRTIAVVITELVARRWYHYFLHNQRGQLLSALLLMRGAHRIAIVNLPWYLKG